MTGDSWLGCFRERGRDGFKLPNPLPLLLFLRGERPGVGTRLWCWTQGTMRLPLQANRTPTSNTHTLPLGCKGAGLGPSPPILCGVGDPGMGFSTVATVGWLEAVRGAEGSPRMAVSQAGWSRWGGTRVGGGSYQNMFGFLHTERQEQAAACTLHPYSSGHCRATVLWGAHLSLSQKVISLAGREKVGSQLGMVGLPTAAAACVSPTVEEPGFVPSPHLAALLCVCAFCLVLLGFF